MWSRNKAGITGLAIFLIIAVLPMVGSLLYALLYSVGLAGWMHEGFTVHNWELVLGSGDLWASTALSVVVAATVCAISCAGGLWLALWMRERVTEGVLSYMLYLPLALPATVAAFIGSQMLSATGLLSRLCYLLGVRGLGAFPPLTNDALYLGVIITHSFIALPFLTVVFSQLYRSERIDLYTGLSRSLGATPRQATWRVCVPMLLRKARPNIALLFILVLGSYEIPLLLGRQSPQMLSLLTVRKYQRFDVLQKPQAFAIALFYALLVLTLLITWIGPTGRRRVS